jgi:major membrane immunogen (membrane-anchored lipoprotein)
MRRILLVLGGLLVVTAAFAAAKLTDGTYTGTYDAMDSHGWKPQMTVVIKGGKIADVSFDYVNKKGELKTKDVGYNKAMMAKNKTNPEKAYPELAKALVAKQDAPVDAVTGATGSSANFNALAVALVAKAKAGDKSPTVLGMNETYAAEDQLDKYGYKAKIQITFENGRISKVDYDEFDKDGKSKKADEKYAKNMKAKSKVSPAEAITKLVDGLMTKQDPAKVDAVTGATELFTRFVTLAKQVLASR